MATELLYAPRVAFQSGTFAPGAKATFYLSGSTTPVTVYSDTSYSVAHASPVVADAAGVFPPVFYNGANEIKCVITASDDTAIATIDPVGKSTSSGSAASTIEFTPITGNAATNIQDAIENNTNNLTPIEAIGDLGSLGYITRTGSGTYAARVFAAGNGIDMTAGGGTASNTSIAADFASDAEAEAGTSTTKVMSPATTLAAINEHEHALTLGTQVATTSGTAFDFTSLPAGLNRITVMFDGVSLDGTGALLVQLGDSGGFETSGYVSVSNLNSGGATSTAGFLISVGGASRTMTGTMVLSRMNGNKWIATSNLSDTALKFEVVGSGSKLLSAELTQVRLTRDGSDNFDAGALNISYQ